jgi:hypothetical protein
METYHQERNQMPTNINQLITLKVAKDIIGCSRGSIYRYCAEGKKSSTGEMVRLKTIRPSGSRDMFTTPRLIEDFLTATFPVRQVKKFENTLDVLELRYGIDTSQARSAMISAPVVVEQPAS